MDELLKKLEADYQRVRSAWERCDYVDYLRQLRPAMENFCRIVIMDVKGPTLYEEIVDGEYPIDGLKNVSKGQPIRNSLLARAIYPLIVEEMTLNKDEQNKIKGACNRLTEAFFIASELGNHTGKSSLNAKLRAYDNMQLLPACAESFTVCGVLSEDISNFFTKTLQPLDISESDTQNTIAETQNAINETILKLRQQLIQRESEIISQKAQINDANERALAAQREALEAERTKSTADNKMIEKLSMQIEELQQQLMHLRKQDESPLPAHEAKHEEDTFVWNIEEESMDDDQLDIIHNTMDSSMLIAGCAGSGKSLIALYKAKQLLQTGASVLLIAYTKSLRSFMNVGQLDEDLKSHCLYHYQWKDKNMPAADYVIVDEIQDFTKDEISEFMAAAKKHYIFFGDTAQSIYHFKDRRTMTIEQIAEMTGLDVMMLYNNYRLPRPVAKITQGYVGINVPEYKDRVYQSRVNDIPHIVGFQSDEDQIQTIINLFKESDMLDTGILLPDNSMVVALYERLLEENICPECKYSLDKEQTINTLNFTTRRPKLMTYHSAKGLQFKKVILPFCETAMSPANRKALYVAMTRTQKELYVMYTGSIPPAPLNNVPSHMYMKTM